MRKDRVSALLTVVDKLLGRISALMLFAMMALTFVDVIGRYILNSPVHGAYELTEVLLALVVFGAAPLVTVRGTHVTTSLFDEKMRPGVKRVRDVSVGMFCAVVCAVLAWRLWEQASSAAQVGRRTPLLDVPIAPFIYFMAVMAGLCVPLFIVALYARQLTRVGQNQSTGTVS